MLRKTFILFTLALAILVGACESGMKSSTAEKPKRKDSVPTITSKLLKLAGQVNGLKGEIVLDSGTGQSLTIKQNGVFSFDNPISDQTNYMVTVSKQPTGTQSCVVVNGLGKISGMDVDNVRVNCANFTYSVGGEISGLKSSLKLQNEAGELFIFNKDEKFIFTRKYMNDDYYNIKIVSQPTTQTCSIINPSGKIKGTNILAKVVCSTDTYAIGGVVYELKGLLKLSDGTGQQVDLPAGSMQYKFSNPLADGTAYGINILSQPQNQACSVVNGSGKVSGTNVNVDVVCADTAYILGGNAMGVSFPFDITSGTGEVLTILMDGPFQFKDIIADGTTYNVQQKTFAMGQGCIIKNEFGKMTAPGVSNVNIECELNAYRFGGMVNGLVGTLELDNGLGETLTITRDGPILYKNAVHYMQFYDVVVAKQPTGQTCAVVNGKGMMPASDVNNIEVNCAVNSYKVGGKIMALMGDIVLESNIGETLLLNGVGNVEIPFVFGTTFPNTSPYDVKILQQPPTQTCKLSLASGTIQGADINNIEIKCSDREYKLGGEMIGLQSGKRVELKEQKNGEMLRVDKNGHYDFVGPFMQGKTYDYDIVVLSNPVAQICAVHNNVGSLFNRDVGDIDVVCSVDMFNLGGEVFNLAGYVDLDDGLGHPIKITKSGPFTFSSKLPDQTNYLVKFVKDPIHSDCTISNASGRIFNADEMSVDVHCSKREWSRAYNLMEGVPTWAYDALAKAKVKVADTGDAYVVWEQVYNGKPQLYLSEFNSKNMTWTRPVNQDEYFSRVTNGISASKFDISINNKGDLLIVWSEELAGGKHDLYYKTKKGLIWSNNTRLLPAGFPSSVDLLHHKAKLSDRGGMVFVWEQRDGQNRKQVYTADFSARKNVWTFPANLSDYRSSKWGVGGANPNLSMASYGDTIVVWSQSAANGSNRVAAVGRFGGVWVDLGDVQKNFSSADPMEPIVAIDENQNLVVAWTQKDNNGKTQVYKTDASIQGNHWTPPKDLTDSVSSGGSVEALYPSIAANKSGKFILSWTQERIVGSYNIYAAIKEFKVWGQTENISSTIPSSTILKPTTAISDNGELIVVWAQHNIRGEEQLFMSKHIPNKPWITPSALNDYFNQVIGSSYGLFPDVSINASGNLMIIWQQIFKTKNPEIYVIDKF
ncbi:MAG: hypothetical protein ABIE74_12085 [Pseudomonadota bacterium]